MIKLEELSYGGQVVLTIGYDEKDKSVVLFDGNQNEIRLGPGGISLTSDKGIQLDTKGNAELSGRTGIQLKSRNDVSVQGRNIQATANVGFTAKGAATAELSASGQTTVKGAMVMIN